MIKMDVSEGVAVICALGDWIFAITENKGVGDRSLLPDLKTLYNGITVQVNKELMDGDEHYTLYPEEELISQQLTSPEKAESIPPKDFI